MFLKKFRRSFFIVGFSAVIFSCITGCIKGNDPQVNQQTYQTYISVADFAYGAPSTELYLNTTKATNPMDPGNYFPSYSGTAIGQYSLTFKKAGGDSILASIPSAGYDTTQFNTIILYTDTNNVSQAFRIIDDFTTLNSTSTFIRSMQMSTELPPLDFYISTTKVASNRRLADNNLNGLYNKFQPFTASTYTLTAKVSSNDSVVASLPNVTFSPGNAYTIFVYGKSGTGNSGIKINALLAN